MRRALIAPGGVLRGPVGGAFLAALVALVVLTGPWPLTARAEADGGATTASAATVHQLRRLGATGCRSVALELDPLEAGAVGEESVLTARGPTGAVELDGAGGAAVLLDGAATLELAYPASASAAAAVTWSQTVTSDQEEVVVRQPWRAARPAVEGGRTLAWHADGTWQRYREQLTAAPGLSVSAPVSLFPQADGTLRGGVDPDFVAFAHDRGVDVWPTVASLDADLIRSALADDARRAGLAAEVAAMARSAGADGVNIDLEGFTPDTSAAVTDFARRLTEEVHAWGGLTSIDLTAMTDTWATPPEAEYGHWSTAPDRRALSDAVDYVVLMAYDEHNGLRPAGPVASPRWVERALRYQLRFTDPDRLILGVSLYGRLWGEVGRVTRPRAIPIAETTTLTAAGRLSPDERFGVDRVDLADGRYVWAETVEALRHRTALVETAGLAGTASWRLGFDDPSVWPLLSGG